MSPTSPYDKYNYLNFWKNREYEHQDEVAALKKFFDQITKRESIIEIGAGFGRIAPVYLPYFKKAYLLDPSASLLQLATANLIDKFSNFTTIKGSVPNLPSKIKDEKFDVVLMLRVLHHIQNPSPVFKSVYGILSKNGYFILEFANKIHFKARISAFLKGDFGFINNTESIDKRSEFKRSHNYINFLNHHPKNIISLLENSGFKIEKILSVSNLRDNTIKKILPLKTILFLSKIMQEPFGPIFFGPSIFILAKKQDKVNYKT